MNKQELQEYCDELEGTLDSIEEIISDEDLTPSQKVDQIDDLVSQEGDEEEIEEN